jgi:hypothetical protein
MSSLPAVFILVGWAATRIKAPLLGAAVAVAVLLPVAVKPSHEHADDNWRAANAAASALVRGTSEPVLARISFIESKQLDRLDDPQRNGLLLGPVSAYPIAARVELLPYDLNAAGVAYIDDLLERKLARPNNFVGEFSGGDREYVLGFNRLMYSRGYRIEKALGFGSIVVLSFGRA